MGVLMMQATNGKPGHGAHMDVAAMDYMQASQMLSILTAERDEEQRIFLSMKRSWVIAFAICVLVIGGVLMRAAFETAGQYNPIMFVLALILLIIIIAMTCALFACTPAGFIGMSRAARRSGWAIWGSPIVMIVLIGLVLCIAMGFGWLFFLLQWRRTMKLDKNVSEAKEQLERMSTTMK